MSKSDPQRDYLLSSLSSPELRARVESGELLILPGQNPEKPVLRDAATGRLVKGSGRAPKANDLGVIAKTTAYKRTRSFTEWFDAFIPSTRDQAPNAIISLEELIKTAAEVAQGYEELLAITCPECKHQFQKTHRSKPDAKLLAFLIERRVGKAKETQEISIRSEQIVQMLNDPTPITTVEVIEVSPAERADRMKQIKAANE